MLHPSKLNCTFKIIPKCSLVDWAIVLIGTRAKLQTPKLYDVYKRAKNKLWIIIDGFTKIT